MANIFGNKLKFKLFGWAFRAQTIPTNFFAALITNAVAPTVDINTFSELTEIAVGNGYTAGGISLTPGATDFDVWTEDDTNDRGLVQIKDLLWTASGGPIPSSGNGARHLILTDDNVTQSAREFYASWDLVSDRTISETQTLTIQDAELRAA